MKTILALVLSFVMLFTVSCNKPKDQLPIKNQENKTPKTQEQPVQNLFAVYDEKQGTHTPLRIDHDEVKSVSMFIKSYLESTENLDYRTVKPESEHPFMSKNALAFDAQTNVTTQVTQILEESKVIAELIDFEIRSIVFNSDFTVATVEYSTTTNIISGKEEALAEMSMTIGKNTGVYALTLVKEDGQWKIDQYLIPKTPNSI